MADRKDEIFVVVQKHLCAIVETIDPAQVARDKSMKDLGASSLDMVEVVSCSMRELKVRVPRAELSKLKDIGGLVDLLAQAEAGAAAAKSAPAGSARTEGRTS
jgi:acyl carrier protein